MQKPRTYAEALEDLGGQPWRALDGTEQWFLVDEPDTREPDTASFRISRSSRGLWIGVAAALLAGGIFALVVVPAAAPPTFTISAPAAQVVFVAAPAPVALAAAPVSATTEVSVAAPAPQRVWKRHFKHRKRR